MKLFIKISRLLDPSLGDYLKSSEPSILLCYNHSLLRESFGRYCMASGRLKVLKSDSRTLTVHALTRIWIIMQWIVIIIIYQGNWWISKCKYSEYVATNAPVTFPSHIECFHFGHRMANILKFLYIMFHIYNIQYILYHISNIYYINNITYIIGYINTNIHTYIYIYMYIYINICIYTNNSNSSKSSSWRESSLSQPILRH